MYVRKYKSIHIYYYIITDFNNIRYPDDDISVTRWALITILNQVVDGRGTGIDFNVQNHWLCTVKS